MVGWWGFVVLNGVVGIVEGIKRGVSWVEI